MTATEETPMRICSTPGCGSRFLHRRPDGTVTCASHEAPRLNRWKIARSLQAALTRLRRQRTVAR